MDNLEQFLRGLPIFSNFSGESMGQILENTTIKECEPEEVVIRFGQPGTFLSIVLEGEVGVVIEDPGGHRRFVRKIGKGECFGEMSLMTGDPTSADVIADEGCRIAIIPADVFSKTIAVNPESVRNLAKLMTHKLMEDNVKMGEQIQLSEDTTHVVSHELKSPFAGIATLAMAMLEPNIPMDKKEMFLQRIISKALGAKSMIEEYLTLSSISAGEMQVFPEKVSFYNEVIEKVLDHQKEIMAEKGITAANHISVELEVVCDPKFIQIVYNNLISNAVKYGTPHTEIYIGHVEKQDGYHYFNVANIGEWIKEDDRPRVFEKYVRLGRRGTGIGLHTSKDILEKHGGDIWVEPCYLAEGKCLAVDDVAAKDADDLATGNNFVFTLPVK